jgi:uncharacterized membrane protein YqjE
MTMTDDRDPQDLSTPELVRQASSQIATLVRDEIALARVEMVEKGRRAGVGAGLFGAAGVLAALGVACLVATAILALSLVWPAWLSALTVGIAILLAAAGAALAGRRKLASATPPYPTEAAQGIGADLDTVRTAVQERSAP